ncbi:MAG: MATE family efflux transporter [Lachnospiraceae bacterium]|nr:MATE family efflux transporter [Lachnospiraceae bacterium]
MDFSREERMGSAAIPGLILGMSVPSIVAQVINVLYNIVDRIYIGHIPGVGAAALTGVGLTFPITILVSAFSSFASAGGAPLAAIWLGKGDRERAEKILGSSLWLLLVFTAALMVVFYAFHRPFLFAFGASEDTISYASSYLKIYLAGTLFVELALGLNTFIIVQGQSRIAMYSILIGAVVNIALDPVFIFALGWGVRGAAAATVISQAVSAFWNLKFLMGRKSTLKIRASLIHFDARSVRNVFSLGISPFIMRSTECLINVVMNRQLQIYGNDLYVGSMTIMQSVMQLLSAPLSGFTQGVQPIISYNFGAGKFDRVRTLYRIMIGICFVFAFAATGSAVLFPESFAGMFTTDTDLVRLVGEVMPVFLFGMLFFGVQQGIQPTFLALGQAKISLFIALLRKVILLVPLALILPRFLGVMGVCYAEPVSDLLSAATASVLFLVNIRKILSEETLDKIV